MEGLRLNAVLKSELGATPRWWIGVGLGLTFIGAYFASLGFFGLTKLRQVQTKQRPGSVSNEKQHL